MILTRSTWLVALLALASCVTVNIYFPAAAAEKAADSIIDDVWNESAMVVPNNAPVVELGTYSASRELLVGLLNVISADAQAQSVDFNASSPKIEQIKSRMGTRFSQMKPLFASGAIGLTGDGYVAIRDAQAAPMAQRGQMNQWVNAENADRKALYQAIAEANNQPSWFAQIQETFAQRWISQAPSGWWYQSNGQWKQK
ncbi:YdbL family protein [Suttonella sp. R2A3]|uniref:YdbL family protein n=1 Tax=Suttonella sp. R2A3 TaxID=2908648 RepID=UPI001F1A39DC|nr:YdbL family protein [Suttonella sp. R2A3]UJF23943.1 YdbL family protein [Suttonella sp. R2A3]